MSDKIKAKIDDTSWKNYSCIEWSGPITKKGYGLLSFKYQNIGVHRLAWMLENGRLPLKNMDICHHCDNRKCINAKHLFEGTRKDNMQDAKRKGRIVSANKLKTICKNGHPLIKENMYIKKSGARSCRICMRMHQSLFRKRKKSRNRVLAKETLAKIETVLDKGDA